jgi:hypothetical protein
MKKEKKIWISLILMFILIIVLSGCSGITGPKMAKINISFDPNPATYPVEGESWLWETILTECNGVGVTLTSLTFDLYNQDQKVFTDIWDETWVEGLFDSNYLPAFSSLQGGLGLNVQEATHQIITITGVDDNNNQIEAIGRLDFLSQ